MHCPFCNATDTRVIDSRLTPDGFQVRRRRECSQCSARFSTYETVELKPPNIVKSDGRRESFNVDKLRAGVERALQKRPVRTQDVEAALNRVVQRLKTSGEQEVKSLTLGDWVMEELRNLDQVAYVRFASVYRRFRDVQEFREEIERLEKEASELLDTRQLSLLSDEFTDK